MPYYAVDHSPSYMWSSATWEISQALIPFVPAVMSGPDTWAAVPTTHHAIEIRDGVVHNSKLLTFQDRSPDQRQPSDARSILPPACRRARGVDSGAAREGRNPRWNRGFAKRARQDSNL